MPVLLPFPRLVERYVELKDKPSAERLHEAETVTAADLAEEFAESVAAHASFAHIDEPFFPGASHRDGPKSNDADARTFGWSMAIKRTPPPIVVAGAPELNFRYAEREIIPTRTQHRPTCEEGIEGKQVRVDLVLANATSRRPIVGELKIAGDKDPYTGLVQALAGASQLVSVSQRQRLNRHVGPGVSGRRAARRRLRAARRLPKNGPGSLQAARPRGQTLLSAGSPTADQRTPRANPLALPLSPSG